MASDRGKPIPESKPNEANRKFHENGMSIIVPPGWRRARWHTERDANELIFVGGDSPTSFFEVELVDDSFDASRYRMNWDLNGQAAAAYQETYSRGGRFGRKYFLFEIVVGFEDRRFRIAYKSQEGLDQLPPSVVAYLKSFLPPPAVNQEEI